MSGRLANRRIRFLVLLFVIGLGAVAARAAWLQGVESRSLEVRAAGQHEEEIVTAPRRGVIYDRNGRELAIGELTTTVFANPKHIEEPEEVADHVAADLGIDRDTVLAKLSDTTRGFVYLARKADPSAALALEEREIDGLGFTQEERRIYPQRAVAAEVVGLAGLDNEGLEGIEAYYDETLAGHTGRETKVTDPFGRTIDVVDREPVRAGHDVYLTIDHRLQSHVERVLRRTKAYWKAKAATAVVLDPRSGEVLAMASEPSFDPAAIDGLDLEDLRNRAITDSYEPGSTFKVVTVAAALEEEAVSPGRRFVLAPDIEVADRTIGEASPRGTETMTVSDIIANSSNVGAITLALLLGEKRVADWIGRFGFGTKTGVDFPGETEGIVIPREDWSGSTIGNVPIGQGLAATPLQVATLYATLANGGKRVQPHLVQRVDGPAELTPEPETQRIVSKQTAKQIGRMLERVVTSGSGTLAQVDGYKVAGKTGTSAKVEPDGTYSTRRYVASFVGFVPARDPQLVVLVAVDEPKQDIFGGKVAAPAFAQITDFAVQYLEIPPDVRGRG